MIEFVKKLNLTGLLIGVVTVVFITFCFMSYALFLAVFVLTSAAMLACILIKHKNDSAENDIKPARRIFIYIFIVCISIIFVIARNFNSVTDSMLFGGIVFLIVSVAVIAAATALATKVKAFNIKISKEKIIEYLPIIIAMVLAFVLSIDSFYTYPSNDAREYYTALEQINIFTFNSLDTLKLCNHLSIVYAMVVYLLYCVVGKLYAAAILFNILCVMLSILVMYKLIKLLCPKSDKLFAYLGAFLFAFSANAFGMTGYVYIDVAAMYAALFFLYAFLAKDDYLIFLSAGFLMFTKEQGVFVSAVLIFGSIIFKLVKSAVDKRFWNEAEKQFSFVNLCFFVLHLVFVLFFVSGKNWAQSGGWFKFGLNIPSLSALFLTNFNWVFAICIAAAVVKFIVEHLLGKINLMESCKANKALLPVLITFALMMAFNLFVVTWNHYRYLLVQAMTLYILGIFSINYLFKDLKIKRIKPAHAAIVLLLSLVFVQNYFTIDPTMLSSKDKFSTGVKNSYILPTGYRDNSWFTLDDNLIYNKQASHFDKACDKVLAAINYDSSACIVTGYDFSSGRFKGRGFDLTSNVYGDSFGLGWDSVKQRRFDTTDKSQHLNYYQLWLGVDIDWFLSEDNFERYYYLDYNIGLYDGTAVDTSINHVKSMYPGIIVEETFEVSYFSWHFTVSKIAVQK